MSVKIDASGRRSVQSEAIVPGSPDQVWQAISTGPGVSSWFVPCQIEEKVGGKIVSNFGPEMDSEATVTAWNPPHGFSADGSEMSPGGPKMATEWTIEAVSGDTCRVRVVHSWFAETDEWDGQFEGTELGWPAFFRDLALYLTNFFGQPSRTFQLMGFSTESQDATWAKLVGMLGLEGAVWSAVGSPVGVPSFSGTITYLGSAEHPEEVLLLDAPAPGVAHFFAMPMGGMVCLSIRVFLFGSDAADVADREGAVWGAWVAEQFPMPSG